MADPASISFGVETVWKWFVNAVLAFAAWFGLRTLKRLDDVERQVHAQEAKHVTRADLQRLEDKVDKVIDHLIPR